MEHTMIVTHANQDHCYNIGVLTATTKKIDGYTKQPWTSQRRETAPRNSTQDSQNAEGGHPGRFNPKREELLGELLDSWKDV